MDKPIIKLAYCPTRRDVFSREEAIKFNDSIRSQMAEFPVEVVDLEGINEEKLLFQDCDIQPVIDRFLAAKVDAVFFPHCNFGSEPCMFRCCCGVPETMRPMPMVLEAETPSAVCLQRARCCADTMYPLHT